tara:strand:- start:342 stop:893 length:552 start_codon:yes stop_codon:yes gene_type:complete
MVLLESISLKHGMTMPDFSLLDPYNESHNSNTLMGSKGLAIFFTCNHCPYAIAIWERSICFAKKSKKLGINCVAINPNINPLYPDDSPENMKQKIENDTIPFPYLIDIDQNTARGYHAQCTPDIYLLDNKMQLFYHGRLDDNWQNPNLVKTEDLLHACQALINNEPIPIKQYPSMGCSIKWVN